MPEPRDNQDAPSAFLAREIDIDSILARLAISRAEHFNRPTKMIT